LRHAAGVAVVIVIVLAQPAFGTEFFGSAGPRYIYNTEPRIGGHWALGGSLGVEPLDASWGKLALECDFGFPVSRGEASASTYEWEMSWLAGVGSVQTPGNVFARLNLAYLSYWVEIFKDPGPETVSDGGFLLGGAVGWAVSEKLSVVVDAWPLMSASIDWEKSGKFYRFGASMVVRF